jgi:glycerophosphoryl diester phosphodiesterase
MSQRKKIMKNKIIWFFIFLFAFVYLNNRSFLVKPHGKPLLLAHRGLAQTFSMEGITGETNTAERIYPPEHPYLENTIPSMEAAFRDGADMVEFDIHPTKDGKFAVFHDWNLDYRTNGTGTTREHTMAELKALDVGYGYTADRGKTFPFRGKGIGLMPSLDEVLDHFPHRSFLIHVKSDDPQEGDLLAQYLKKLPEDRLARLNVYGGDKPIAILKQKLPRLRVMSKETAKKAFIAYMAVGWTGYMPSSMKNAFFYLPLKYARFLWGWPHRLIQRIKDADSYFFVVAGKGEWSEGFDTLEALKQIPANYQGGIWTNRIDRIGPVLKDKKSGF